MSNTEDVNAATHDLDLLSSRELVDRLARENQVAVDSVRACGESIARAIDLISERLERGGALHYFGAGTGGRLGFGDAAECPPTFGTRPALVRAHIAGGNAALAASVEGAEDNAAAGAREAMSTLGADDAVVGISASGGAPYVVAAIEAARSLQAATIGITSNAHGRLSQVVDLAILVDTGAEAIAGSTRLKAGTAQKLVLNALSTGAMTKLGMIYDNLMVDVVATNEKLRNRARLLVTNLVPTDAASAGKLLDQADWSVKVAVVMGRRGVDADSARGLLRRARGSLRSSLS